MNRRQLLNLGVPEDCIKSAILAIQSATSAGKLRGKELKQRIKKVLEEPARFVDDQHFGPFVADLTEQAKQPKPTQIDYATWGSEIDDAAHKQMRQACRVPMAAGAALMPDAHLGYGLPIGGVLGLKNAVVPYAVGVDIACRMKLSVLDCEVSSLTEKFPRYKDAVQRGTRFGIGVEHETPKDHPVLEQDWSVSPVTRKFKDRAWKQLGTSGSGNHFVEFGVLTVGEGADDLNIEAGEYVALLSHSGSRGPGAAVCNAYSRIARSLLPKKHEDLAYLSWLSLDSEAGQEYWAAMSLMGDYAAANHAVIHRLVTKLLGARIIAGVENHHNFAWKEIHNGEELIVHRKGATPAGKGQLGIIPGSMADPGFVVRGKGNPRSLNSASHGAGRRMSRRQARDTYRFSAVKKELKNKGIHVLSAGSDEVPGVYKNIESVMREQTDLVETIARFDPKIVKMCDDGSRAED